MFYSAFPIIRDKSICLMEPPPRKPEESECCGNGCKRCVFDLYEEEYKIWRNKTSRIGDGACTTLSPDNYTGLVVDNIKKLTSNTNLYTMSSRNNESIARLEMGLHVIIKAVRGREVIVRQYTPIEGMEDDGKLHLVIKTYAGGLMSSTVVNWKEGDIIQLRGPLGNAIDYSRNKWETVIIAAAGTGLTPMVKLVQTILSNEEEETVIIFLYSCRKYEDILLKDMFDEWREHWNFDAFYFLSRENCETVKTKKRYGEKTLCSRVTQDFLENLVKDRKLNLQRVISYVCGTTDFETSIEQYLLACGIFQENIVRF